MNVDSTVTNHLEKIVNRMNNELNDLYSDTYSGGNKVNNVDDMAKKRNEDRYIVFETDDSESTSKPIKVTGDEGNAWKLETGRIAKKKNENKTWRFTNVETESVTPNEHPIGRKDMHLDSSDSSEPVSYTHLTLPTNREV